MVVKIHGESEVFLRWRRAVGWAGNSGVCGGDLGASD